MKRNHPKWGKIITSLIIAAVLAGNTATAVHAAELNANAAELSETAETQDPAQAPDSTEAKNPADLTEADLLYEPTYGANPDYTYFTTVEYTTAQKFIATISANEDLTRFEIICMWFGDGHKTIVNKDGENMSVEYDRTGFMRDDAPKIVSIALKNNIWVPVSRSTKEYWDPAEHDNDPTWLQAGVYDEDFVRSNPNLNGLAWDIDDETLAAYKQPANTKGKVVTFEYGTYFYPKDAADGNADSHKTPIKKTAYVYLPAGYDASKQYNVLYLIHGGGDTASKWFSQQDGEMAGIGEGYAVNILDNLFANGKADPCIVVTPGMYDAEGFNDVEGATDFTSNNFNKELQDLMVAVESTYSTYAKDTTKAGLIASRNHRAMAGLSMGSITIWRSGIDKSIDMISWFANMSGGSSADEKEALAYVDSNIIPALEKASSNGYKINMMLSFNGTMDMALKPQVAAHHSLVEYAQNSNILTVGENYDFIVSNGSHAFTAWNLYLYDLMQVFFKGDIKDPVYEPAGEDQKPADDNKKPANNPPGTSDKDQEATKKTYEILKGTDGLWTANSDGSVTIKVNGQLADFVALKIDGNQVDPANYTLKAGSTIVTLKAGYLKTLGKGDHTLTFVYKDGAVSMTLPLGEGGKPIKASSPQTGDELPAAPVSILFCLAAVLLFGSFLFRSKNRKATL